MGLERPLNASSPGFTGNATLLQGRDISTAAPGVNEILTWNNITSEWEPAAPGIPGAHASTHEDAGGDEIDVTGLSGELADDQPPKAHAASHSDGALDEVTVENLVGASVDISTALRPDGAGGVAFSDVGHGDLTGVTSDQHHAQDHAASHDDGAADEVTLENLATAGAANTVAKSDGAGGLAMGSVAHSEVTGVGIDDHHARDHASTHSDGAADEVTVEDLATAGGSGTVPISDGAGGLSMGAPDPAGHDSTHENGGTDEINVGSLSGELADPQPPKAHAASHKDGGADELDVEEFATAGAANTVAKSDGAGGLAMGSVAHSEVTSVGIDDHHARDHAASHSDGGADEVSVEALATAGAANLVPVSDGAGGLSMAAPAPAAHETSHRSGGSDQVDHDLLLNFVANEHIDWTNAAVNLVTTGDVTGTSIYGDGSNLSGVGAAAATALTFEAKVNEAGGITKGQAVYISGATGQLPQVSLCDNTVTGKHGFTGLAAETKTDGQNILIRGRGELVGLVTSSWLDGDALYVSTAGALTKVKPTVGSIDHIGYVSYSHGSAGKIMLTMQHQHDMAVAATEDMVIRLGDSAGSNKFYFKDYANAEVASVDSDGNITGASLRAPRVMNLNPEYPGAVLYPDGANNDCVITSGHDQTNHRNYVEITADAATNDYDIVLEVRVPTGWTWDSAKIYAWTDDESNVVMACEIFDTTGTTDGSDTVTPSADNTWEEIALTTPGGTYASEGLFHIHLKGTIGAADKKARFGAILFKSST